MVPGGSCRNQGTRQGSNWFLEDSDEVKRGRGTTHRFSVPESTPIGPYKRSQQAAWPSGQSSWTTNRPFLERLGVCFSLPSVQGPDSGVCQELSLRLLQSCGAQERRPLPWLPELGPQGAATKTGSPDLKQKQEHQVRAEAPLWEVLVAWAVAGEECEVGDHWLQ